jgi:hypothetical protein
MDNFMGIAKIEDVYTLKPEEDDIIIVTINCGNLPAHVRHQYLENYNTELKKIFPNNKLIIKQKNSVEFSLEKEKDVKQEVLEPPLPKKELPPPPLPPKPPKIQISKENF